MGNYAKTEHKQNVNMGNFVGNFFWAILKNCLSHCFYWQGQQGSNPRPTVLEAGECHAKTNH